jgi:hypothetical protein
MRDDYAAQPGKKVQKIRLRDFPTGRICNIRFLQNNDMETIDKLRTTVVQSGL